MKKKGNQAKNFADGELQCFVGTREVGKRGGSKNQNGSNSETPTKRLSDILLMRRFIRGAATRNGDNNVPNKQNEKTDLRGLESKSRPASSDAHLQNNSFNHRLVGQSASSLSSSSTNMRTNSSSLLMSTNSSTVSGSGGYFSGVGGRYMSRNSSVRSGQSCVSAKSNVTALTAVSSLTGSSSICSSASAVAAYKKGRLI